MENRGTVRLETPRLILRRFDISDAPAMFRNWAGDPAVTEFLTWPTHTGADISRCVLAEWAGRYAEPDFYQWAIELKAIAEPVGSISVVRMNQDIGECELGWCIGSAWWGQGIVPEAAACVLRFLFRDVGAARVAARHAVGNEKSGRVMQKLGMVKEGVLRRADMCNLGIVDAVVYAMLAEEYADPR